jgi:hypothetical protein
LAILGNGTALGKEGEQGSRGAVTGQPPIDGLTLPTYRHTRGQVMTTSAKIWVGILAFGLVASIFLVHVNARPPMTEALSFLGMMLFAIGRPEIWCRDSLIRREEKWWQPRLRCLGLRS